MKTSPIIALLFVWIGSCAAVRSDGPGGQAVAAGPLNVADYVGSTVTLTCSSTNSAGYQMVWTEFASTPGGAVISDNDAVVPGHPNAARYQIVHNTAFQFDLVISDVVLSDGGTYLCEDQNAVPPEKTRAQAEFIVFEGAPNCTTTVGLTGVVLENQLHTMECAVNFQGNVPPTMTWTGPDPFEVVSVDGDTSLWSGISFVVSRSMNGGTYECLTNFTAESFAQPPPDGATNPPSFSYLYTFPQLFVSWGPKDMYIAPEKQYYLVGDVVTCFADANPPASFQWQNMRTLDTSPGPSFTVTEDFEGLTTKMRCQAQNEIQEVIYSGDLFTDIIVLEITTAETTTTSTTTPTTTTPPTTTPTQTPTPTQPNPSATTLPPGSSTTVPLPSLSCDDLSGRWQATNPTATLCLEILDQVSGEVTGLMRNGTDAYYFEVDGRASTNFMDLIGWAGIWPRTNSVVSFVGECRRCNGTAEVLIADPLSRSIELSPGCGLSGPLTGGQTYYFHRQGASCSGATLKVWKPTHISKRLGIVLE